MDEFAKRISDLQQRSRDRNMLTHTTFLTPAEAYEVRGWNIGAYLSGGGENCEREMAFFLPEYIEPENLDIEKYIAAVKVETKFASPSHRDFLGSFLGLGVNRDAVGDIIVTGDGAYIYCLPSVAEFGTGRREDAAGIVRRGAGKRDKKEGDKLFRNEPSAGRCCVWHVQSLKSYRLEAHRLGACESQL